MTQQERKHLLNLIKKKKGKPVEVELKEASEAIEMIKIYVERDYHDHIGSIEKAFHRTSYIRWDYMPKNIRDEYDRLSKVADNKIEYLRFLEANGY